MPTTRAKRASRPSHPRRRGLRPRPELFFPAGFCGEERGDRAIKQLTQTVGGPAGRPESVGRRRRAAVWQRIMSCLGRRGLTLSECIMLYNNLISRSAHARASRPCHLPPAGCGPRRQPLAAHRRAAAGNRAALGGHRLGPGGAMTLQAIRAGGIRLDDVTVAYHRHPAVHHVSGSFEPGSLTAIVGPNGAGKSTLLKAIVGQLPTADGAIERGALKPRDIAYLPQQASLDRAYPISV